MNDILFNGIISKIQKEILASQEVFETVRKIDMRYGEIKVELEKLIQILQSYKNKKPSNLQKEICVYCNGSPYIVLNLCLIGILNGISVKLNIEDMMIGVNTYILEVVNKVIEAHSLDIKFEIVKEFDTKAAIFIDRVNEYSILRNKLEKAKFIPYQALDIFCDTDSYKELLDTIYAYGLSMNIDIDIFEDDQKIEDVIKLGTANRVLFLTNKPKKTPLGGTKKVYVNSNPFEEEKTVFSDEMIDEIIK